MITSATVVRRAKDVRHRLIKPEAVVIRQAVPEVLVLNDVAGEILDRLDGQTAVGGIVDALLPHFDVERVTLERDALRFVDEMLEAGILEVVGDGA